MSSPAYPEVGPPAAKSAAPGTAKSGIWVAVAAISMSFAAFTSALVVRQGSGNDWRHIVLPSILYLNTVILLASSGALEMSRREFRQSLRSSAPAAISSAGRLWLSATFFLGLCFVGGQWLAWRELRAEGLYLATTPNSSFFYLLTVLHALHLLGGMLGLLYVLRRVSFLRAAFRMTTLDAAAIYWHFMGGLWIYLFLVIRSRL